jgi:hypothetical protein
LQEFEAIFSGEGLWVKLYAIDGQGAVSESHYFPFLGPCSDDEVIGKRVFFDEKGVVSGGGKGAWDIFKKILPMVVDGRRFAMHEAPGADNFTAEELADTLVPEADPEEGDVRTGEGFDEAEAVACFIWATGAWGNEDPIRFEGKRLGGGQLVVSEDLLFDSKLAEILDEIVRERVKVIENEKHRVRRIGYETSGVNCANGWLKKRKPDRFIGRDRSGLCGWVGKN